MQFATPTRGGMLLARLKPIRATIAASAAVRNYDIDGNLFMAEVLSHDNTLRDGG